jgi:hypothetical protein
MLSGETMALFEDAWNAAVDERMRRSLTEELPTLVLRRAAAKRRVVR